MGKARECNTPLVAFGCFFSHLILSSQLSQRGALSVSWYTSIHQSQNHYNRQREHVMNTIYKFLYNALYIDLGPSSSLLSLPLGD